MATGQVQFARTWLKSGLEFTNTDIEQSYEKKKNYKEGTQTANCWLFAQSTVNLSLS